MKKGIFAVLILAASMAMVACTNNSSATEGATITTEDETKAKEEADKEALKILEKKRKGN